MIENCLEVFMDDLTIFGNFVDKYLDNLERVLEWCKKKRLVLNWEKCHFITISGIVLVYVVSFNGTEVDKAKVEVISNLPSPNTIREFQLFLWHVGFYRRFIKNFSAISRQLCNFLIKDTTFMWTKDYQNSFEKIINFLTLALIM